MFPVGSQIKLSMLVFWILAEGWGSVVLMNVDS